MVHEVIPVAAPTNVGDFTMRVSTPDGNPVFIATDIAKALGRSNPFNMVKPLSDDEKGHIAVMTPGGPQTLSYVTEAGLYRLLMRSHSPNARLFQDWLVREVLPAIRKNGGYLMGQEKLRTGEMSGDELFSRAITFARATVERLGKENVTLQSKSVVPIEEARNIRDTSGEHDPIPLARQHGAQPAG